MTGSIRGAALRIGAVLALAAGLGATRGVALPPGAVIAATGLLGGQLIEIDPADGSAQVLVPIGSLGPVTDLARRGDGVLFGSTGAGTRRIITIDPASGLETEVGQHAPGIVAALSFVDQELYGAFLDTLGPQPWNLVRVDQADGQLTTVGPLTVPIFGLAYLEASDDLYGIGDAALYRIDRTTGASVLVAATGVSGLRALARAGAGRLYAGTGTPAHSPTPRALVAVDPTTGVASVIGDTGFPLSGLVVVPLPPPVVEIPALSGIGGLGLALLLAAVGLALAARRRGLGR